MMSKVKRVQELRGLFYLAQTENSNELGLWIEKWRGKIPPRAITELFDWYVNTAGMQIAVMDRMSKAAGGK